MLDAVLFDWGDTLFHFDYDERLLEQGWQAGLAAIGRDGLPGSSETSERFRERYFPLLFAPGTIEEVEYPELVRELLGGFGVALTDVELAAFLSAEHEAWRPARRLGPETHALLDAIRARGVKVGLVSNAFDPGWLLRADLVDQGLSERLDVAVFSSEVGVRKPHPEIFRAALESLGADPARTLFVGDRRYEDMRGAAELGMTTVLAVWYRDDPDDGRGLPPDHEAKAQMDVLDIVLSVLDEV